MSALSDTTMRRFRRVLTGARPGQQHTVTLRWRDDGRASPVLARVDVPDDDLEIEGEIIGLVAGTDDLGNAALVAENAVESAASELGILPLRRAEELAS